MSDPKWAEVAMARQEAEIKRLEEQNEALRESATYSLNETAVRLIEMERLRAENETLRQDALRYRWLRECNPARSDRTMYVTRAMYKDGIFIGNDCPHLKYLDAAIDAALKEGK